jgi:hypothetical protein
MHMTFFNDRYCCAFAVVMPPVGIKLISGSGPPTDLR